MAAKTLTQILAELRSCGSTRLRRSARVPDAAPLIARLLGPCRTLAVEERASGLAFRLQGATDSAAAFTITCVLHLAGGRRGADYRRTGGGRAAVRRADARADCQLRGVSPNTVKSQVRQIFRKLNVESRVALVRLLCP